VVGLVAAPAAVHLMGASEAVRPYALTYLRISLLGAPAVPVALVGVGYLRGLQDTAGPLRIALAANVFNVVAEVALIYGAGLGVGASAAATVAAQVGAAVLYARSIVHHARVAGVSLQPDPAALRVQATGSRGLFVRIGSLQAALALATAVASRLGTVQVAAHQIAFHLWLFLALAIDALAIAGQAMTGHRLGAGRADDARAAARRLLEWGLVVGVVFAVAVTALRTVLPRLFTGDPRVASLAADLLWFVALLQPVNAAVFILDGVLIGAGDLRFLGGAMLGALVVFAPAALAVGALDWPLAALWGALALFMVTRLVTMTVRYAGTRWAVTGPGD
jgi:putative MATE family efflux protein